MDSNGSLEGLQERSARASQALENEQTLADSDRTLADSDQTLSDTDQTGADTDQTSSDRDQLAADSDQEAADRDLAAGADAEAHAFSHDVRERTTEERRATSRVRDQTARARLDAAEERDEIASARDVAARARDRAAEARDLAIAQAAEAHEPDEDAAAPGAGRMHRAAARRKRASQLRVHVAGQRAAAAEDRRAAAADRDVAATERLRALVDREALARQVALSETDGLTGARTRAAGLTDLDHELERCRRTGTTLIAAYVDIVGLKALNDTAGHSAGDALIKRVVDTLTAHLRPYDLIVRIGGDEFLCAMSGMSWLDARERFATITSAPHDCPIRTGFAELASDDSATTLVERADADLIAGSAGGRGARSASSG